MDDKDSLFTISHNNENNELNSSDINSDTDVLNNNSEHTVVEADSAVLQENNEIKNTRRYDDFMYEPIGFENPHTASNEYGYYDSSEFYETKQSKNGKLITVFLALTFGALILLTIVCAIIDLSNSANFFDEYTPSKNVVLYRESKPKSDDKMLEKDKTGRYTTEGVAAKVRPSIIEIYTYSDKSMVNRLNTGSGIILSDDGYIVTNAHVLNSEGYHIVKTSDDKEYSAEIIGRDSKTDIAVIKIEADNLSEAVFGDSDEITVGEQVMAIGNPAGLSGTVTNGIVSAVNRKIRGDSTGFEMNCVQTNADISPGNSGGALVNMYGQVIGITSSKYVSSSYEGLGFAITINEALPIIEELIDNGFVSGRFRVGITLIATDTKSSREVVEKELGHELPEDFYGIYIMEIDENSKIAETQLEAGDFVTKINGESVSNHSELYNALKEFEIGEKIPATCAFFDEEGNPVEYKIEFEVMEDTSGDY